MTVTTTLRPTVDAGGSGFGTVVGAGSALAAVNDNSDASYIEETGGAAGHAFGFADNAEPNRPIVSVTPFLRAWWSGSLANPGNLYMYVNGEAYSWIDSAMAAAHDAIATISPSGGGGPGTPFTTTPSAAAWTRALLNLVEVQIASSVNPEGYRLYDAWLQVVTNEAPSCNVTAPASTQTALRPVIGWTYSDPEGNAQTSYRVKVFSEAQYTAGGFDPSTSTPVWDSGIVASSAVSRQVGVDLADNTTFRAYVQVTDAATNFDWSAWDYIEFDVFRNTAPTVNVTGPADPVTDTTQPTVEWAYADVDPGDTQERYQVKVVDSATYGAGGFDIDSSSAAWDSGTVYSDAVSVEVGAPLTNGETYRAYVRVGDLTAAGTPAVWSSWDYIEFTMTLDVPDAPTLDTPVVE